MADGNAGGAIVGSRFIVRETSDGLGIVVPLARNQELILVLGLFLTIWAASCFFVFFVAPGSAPEGWVTAWLMAGAVGLGVLGWKLFGTERLFITGGALVLSRGLGFLSRRHVFPLEEVTRLRIRTIFIRIVRAKREQIVPRSMISFDVGGSTHDFGADMEAEERSAVYYAILRHLPPTAVAGPADETDED